MYVLFPFSSKEDELEDARSAAQKKVKVLEQQLESEHEERLHFMREKHELESKIMNLQDLASRSADEDQLIKLRKDLKRTKALLKDAQLMIERTQKESSNKVVIRQLKNQVGCWDKLGLLWLIVYELACHAVQTEISIMKDILQQIEFGLVLALSTCTIARHLTICASEHVNNVKFI